MTPKVDSTTYHGSVSRSRAPYSDIPLFFVVHDTDSPSGNSRLYLEHNALNVGIHDLIYYDGTIYNYLPPDRATNHAGIATRVSLGGRTYVDDQVNLVSYGIEIERKSGNSSFYPDEQLLALGWRIADIRSRYPGHDMPIFRHGSIDTANPKRRWDPRDLLVADIEGWVQRAKELYMPPTNRDALWGSIPVNWSFAIPVEWLKRPVKYGKALTREIYITPPDTNAATSIQVFENGFIVYNKTVNKAFGRLYSEM